MPLDSPSATTIVLSPRLPLTADALQNLSSTPTKTGVLRKYIQSQEVLRGFYARQGPIDFASFTRDGDSLDSHGPSLSTAKEVPFPKEHVSAFASPILKPRNAIDVPSTGPTACDDIQPSIVVRPITEVPHPPDMLPTLVVGDTAMCSPTKKGKENSIQKSMEISESIGKHPIKARLSEEQIQRTSELEHAQRLKERRERRRAKREIQKPPPPPPSTSSSSEESSPRKTRHRTKKKVEKRKKKSIGLSGLTLMNNFSAENVGKNRLTIKRPVGIGLFGGGKSSADVMDRTSYSKDRSKKRKTSGVVDLFSAFAYSKPNKRSKELAESSPPRNTPKRPSRSKHRAISPETESSDGSSSFKSSIKKSKGRHRKQGEEEDNDKPKRRPHDSPSTPVVRVSESDAVVGEAHEPKCRRTRYLSPPWEIDGELVGDLVSVSEDSGGPQSPKHDLGSPSKRDERIINLVGKWGLGDTGDTTTRTNQAPKSPKQIQEKASVGLPSSSHLDAGGTTSRFFSRSSNTSKTVAVNDNSQGDLREQPKATSAVNTDLRDKNVEDLDVQTQALGDKAITSSAPIYNNYGPKFTLELAVTPLDAPRAVVAHPQPTDEQPDYGANDRSSPPGIGQGSLDWIDKNLQTYGLLLPAPFHGAAAPTPRQHPDFFSGDFGLDGNRHGFEGQDFPEPPLPENALDLNQGEEPLMDFSHLEGDDLYSGDTGLVEGVYHDVEPMDPEVTGYVQPSVYLQDQDPVFVGFGDTDSNAYQLYQDYDNQSEPMQAYMAHETGDPEDMPLNYNGNVDYDYELSPEGPMFDCTGHWNDDADMLAGDNFGDMDDSLELHRERLATILDVEDPIASPELTAEDVDCGYFFPAQSPEVYRFNEGRALLLGLEDAPSTGLTSVDEKFARDLWRR